MILKKKEDFSIGEKQSERDREKMNETWGRDRGQEKEREREGREK